MTCSFFPVFSSYALNISLNDYLGVCRQSDAVAEPECQVRRYLEVTGDGEGTVHKLLGRKVRQDI